MGIWVGLIPAGREWRRSRVDAEGVRKWMLRAGRGLREASPSALFDVAHAYILPTDSRRAGIGSATAMAGMGVLSSVGSGALTEILTRAIDKLRRSDQKRPSSPTETERVLATEIGQSSFQRLLLRRRLCLEKACPSLQHRSSEPAATHVCRQPRSSWSLNAPLAARSPRRAPLNWTSVTRMNGAAPVVSSTPRSPQPCRRP